MSDKNIQNLNNRYDPTKKGERRLGMLAGKAKIPDDINKYDDEILRIFGFSEEEIAEDMANRNKP